MIYCLFGLFSRRLSSVWFWDDLTPILFTIFSSSSLKMYHIFNTKIIDMRDRSNKKPDKATALIIIFDYPESIQLLIFNLSINKSR